MSFWFLIFKFIILFFCLFKVFKHLKCMIVFHIENFWNFNNFASCQILNLTNFNNLPSFEIARLRKLAYCPNSKFLEFSKLEIYEISRILQFGKLANFQNFTVWKTREFSEFFFNLENYQNSKNWVWYKMWNDQM